MSCSCKYCGAVQLIARRLQIIDAAKLGDEINEAVSMLTDIENVLEAVCSKFYFRYITSLLDTTYRCRHQQLKLGRSTFFEDSDLLKLPSISPYPLCPAVGSCAPSSPLYSSSHVICSYLTSLQIFLTCLPYYGSNRTYRR